MNENSSTPNKGIIAKEIETLFFGPVMLRYFLRVFQNNNIASKEIEEFKLSLPSFLK